MSGCVCGQVSVYVYTHTWGGGASGSEMGSVWECVGACNPPFPVIITEII